MKSQLRNIIILCTCLWAGSCLMAQSFRCDGSLLFSVNNEISTNTINKVVFIPWGGLALGPLYFNPEGHFDALGFNALDNYIYAALEDGNEIVRLKANRTYDVIGRVPGIDTLENLAGDCTHEGEYLLLQKRSDKIMVFEVVDDFQLIDEIPLFWSADSGNTGAFNTRLDDIAVDPTNPSIAYAYQGNYDNEETLPERTRGYILQIIIDRNDPQVGKVTPIAPLSESSIQKIGSLIFSKGGSLYGYGSISDGPEFLQNNLITIDKWSGMASVARERGPTAMSSDGCSCPYQLTFYNDARPRELPCSDTTLTYHLQINNRFFIPIEGVTLTDTVSEGLIIEAITGDYEGNITAGTGVGTNEIEITDLQIPARSFVTINIETRVVDMPAKVTKNRATLTNLPERYGGTLLSDDPLSPGDAIDDTDHLIYPNRMDDYEIDITGPSSCLDSFGSEIKVASSILLPGANYEVKLLDQDFAVDTFQVSVDDQFAFVLDSLTPGKYRLFELTPQTTDCPFAIKDSFITVEAPNDLLVTDVASNSPVCEENEIQLNGSATPGGEVVWRGPARFASENFDVVIPQVGMEYSGNYVMNTEYGYCEKKDTLEVIVAPLIEAEIEGDSVYCERSTLELTANGVGDNINYRWYDPQGVTRNNNPLRLTDAALSDEGTYTVVADNGACKDTVAVVVKVMESPTISFPGRIETDNCKPLILQPEVDGGAFLNYKWSPSTAVDCPDCPEPVVSLPLQPRLKLVVTNEHACQDSTTTNMTLSRDDLVYLPNVFSSNLSTVDNAFHIYPGCQVQRIVHLTIYDAWGVEVLKKEDVTNNQESISWNGFLQSRLTNTGVYNYDIELELVDGGTERIQGTVTFLR